MTEITSPVEKMPEEPTDFVRILRVIEAINNVGRLLAPILSPNILTAYAIWAAEGKPAQFSDAETDRMPPATIEEVRTRFDRIANACIDVVCLAEPFLSAPVEAGGELPEGVPFVN